MQPNTQITIGETTDNYQVDQPGNPIPAVSITVKTGTIVAVPTEGGLATAVLMIVTPRGNVSVLEHGQAVAAVTGADPESGQPLTFSNSAAISIEAVCGNMSTGATRRKS